MTTDYTPRDYLDNLDEEDGFVTLICSECKEDFRGWKLKTVCRICAVPKFPIGVRHITHVAVIHNDIVYALAAPDRHHHVLRVIIKECGKAIHNTQGFLDDKGVYVSRKEALEIALNANQLLDPNSVRVN